jgi:hypothetical protein
MRALVSILLGAALALPCGCGDDSGSTGGVHCDITATQPFGSSCTRTSSGCDDGKTYVVSCDGDECACAVGGKTEKSFTEQDACDKIEDRPLFDGHCGWQFD